MTESGAAARVLQRRDPLLGRLETLGLLIAVGGETVLYRALDGEPFHAETTAPCGFPVTVLRWLYAKGVREIHVETADGAVYTAELASIAEGYQIGAEGRFLPLDDWEPYPARWYALGPSSQPETLRIDAPNPRRLAAPRCFDCGRELLTANPYGVCGPCRGVRLGITTVAV